MSVLHGIKTTFFPDFPASCSKNPPRTGAGLPPDTVTLYQTALDRTERRADDLTAYIGACHKRAKVSFIPFCAGFALQIAGATLKHVLPAPLGLSLQLVGAAATFGSMGVLLGNCWKRDESQMDRDTLRYDRQALQADLERARKSPEPVAAHHMRSRLISDCTVGTLWYGGTDPLGGNPQTVFAQP